MALGIRKLKDLYEYPYFHGIKTKDEAEALWKAKIEESGNPEAYIWFAMESQDRVFTTCLYGSRNDPWSDKPLTGQFLEIQYGNSWKIHSVGSSWTSDLFPMVERKNPHAATELARATIFDNLNDRECFEFFNCNCCNRRLSEKIDRLEIPESEKVMLKKIIPLSYYHHS